MIAFGPLNILATLLQKHRLKQCLHHRHVYFFYSLVSGHCVRMSDFLLVLPFEILHSVYGENMSKLPSYFVSSIMQRIKKL